MSANLKLLPRKEFELILEDGTVVQGKFCTWAFQRFGEKKGLSILDTFAALSDNPTLANLNEIVLCAVEYKERKAKKPNTFDNMQLCDWVDDYTAATGDSTGLAKLLGHMNSDDGAEKKTISEGTMITNGQLSSELLMPQD